MEDEIAILLEHQEKTINILKQALDLAIGKKRAAMEAASALEEENADPEYREVVEALRKTGWRE